MSNYNEFPTLRLFADGTDQPLSEPIHPAYAGEPFITISADKFDKVYSQWSAGDYMGPLYTYVRDRVYVTEACHDVEMTAEDKAIFANLWINGSTPPIALLNGDRHDAEIFNMLGEAAAERGGYTLDKDYAYMEECSYVYWAEQCAAEYDFTPDPVF